MYKREENKNIKSKVVIIKNKAWSCEDIKELLKRNDKAVERAITLLYSFQTYDEQKYGHTGENNGVGFNRLDANILSSFAEQLNKGRKLSSKQIAIARPKLMKYTKQIFNYMAKKAEAERV